MGGPPAGGSTVCSQSSIRGIASTERARRLAAAAPARQGEFATLAVRRARWQPLLLDLRLRSRAGRQLRDIKAAALEPHRWGSSHWVQTRARARSRQVLSWMRVTRRWATFAENSSTRLSGQSRIASRLSPWPRRQLLLWVCHEMFSACWCISPFGYKRWVLGDAGPLPRARVHVHKLFWYVASAQLNLSMRGVRRASVAHLLVPAEAMYRWIMHICCWRGAFAAASG